MSKQLSTTVSRTLLGLAAALVLAAGAHATPKIVKKVPPEFPAEAARQSISQGSVRAKMNIEADGKVSGVEILEAEPRKVFDKAVTRALMDWKFEPSGQKETHEVKLVFKNED